jgi:predicted amidohydrolase YtcJ
MDDLAERARDAIDRGFGIAIHAIGNVGVDRAIDAFEDARHRAGDAPLLRLEHAGVTGAPQWARLARTGAIAVVQPGFVEHVGNQSGGVTFDDHHWLAFAGLAETGVTLAGSSDDPCAPVSPLWCSLRGATRTTGSGLVFEPDQAVPLEDWLRAYTIGAARAGGQEEERGSITPGKLADLVVLDLGDDPAVVETWRSGRRVHKREES